jgi:hypothetical protein
MFTAKLQELLGSKPENEGLKGTRKKTPKARRLRFSLLLRSHFNPAIALRSTNPTHISSA